MSSDPDSPGGSESTPSEVVDAPSSPPSSDDALGALDPQMMSANTQFGFELFAATVQDPSDANVLISPTSVAIAIAMAYNGAVGETQDAIATTLKFSESNAEEVNGFYSTLLSRLSETGDDVELAIANSLWGREEFELNPAFLQTTESIFGAEAETLDFNEPSAIETINTWVSQNTQGKIPTIVEEISPDDMLLLINAVYFNGRWTQAFDPEQTRDRPFTLLDQTQIQHPLMAQTGSFSYLETDQIQAIQLPYGEDQRLWMVVLLPRPELAWADFLTRFTASQWETWTGQFSRRDGTLQLPRFTFDDQMMLNEPLKAMGMAIAFDPSQADFSGLSDASTVISQVQHRTFIEVNEEGTEAAASTSVGISITSVEVPSEPFEMIVDRPFAFAIYDPETQVLLFLGTVINPAS